MVVAVVKTDEGEEEANEEAGEEGAEEACPNRRVGLMQGPVLGAAHNLGGIAVALRFLH